MKALSPEKKEAHRKRIAQTMRAKIAAEPWRKEKMRETAKQSLNVWARSEEGRKKSSDTAIETSSRSEIQAARAEKLSEWRKKNPEKMAEIAMKFASNFKSLPEALLFGIVSCKIPTLKRGQFIHDHMFSSKSHRRQLDMAEHVMKIAVEFDGWYHFADGAKFKNMTTEQVNQKDDEVNCILSKRDWILIRVGQSQFSYRRGGQFLQSCLDALFLIIDAGVPGIYKLGEEYGVENYLSQAAR